MSTYKLSDFDSQGKGDVARWMLTMHSIPFIDNRISEVNWFSDSRFAKDTPFGSLPVLETDGIKLCQPRAIGRLLAKRLGYYGKNDIDQARIDMIVDCVSEVMDHGILIFYFMEDGSQKDKELKQFLKKTVPEALQSLSGMLDENKQGIGFVGESLSWADFEFASQFSWLESFGYSVSFQTNLKNLMNKIFTIPKIKEYVEKHSKKSKNSFW